MKKFILLTGSLTLALGASIAISAGAPVGNIFQSGQPAIATDVNANFKELADRIDALPNKAVYDYNDYIPAVDQTNEFDLTYFDKTNNSCVAKIQYIYTHTTENNEAVLKRSNYSFDGSGNSCHPPGYTNSISLVQRADSLAYTKRTSTSGVNSTTTTYDEPRLPLLSNMQVGQTWGSASIVTSTDSTGSSKTSYFHQRTLEAIVDVTIPYKGGTTYTNCLKIRSTTSFFDKYNDVEKNHPNMRWYCPGLGLVKLIGTKSYWELSDIK